MKSVYGTFEIETVNRSEALEVIELIFPKFVHSQGDLDRQRLLGDRPRDGVYESVLEDGLEGIEHQERYVDEQLLCFALQSLLRLLQSIMNFESVAIRFRFCLLNLISTSFVSVTCFIKISLSLAEVTQRSSEKSLLAINVFTQVIYEREIL